MFSSENITIRGYCRATILPVAVPTFVNSEGLFFYFVKFIGIVDPMVCRIDDASLFIFKNSLFIIP